MPYQVVYTRTTGGVLHKILVTTRLTYNAHSIKNTGTLKLFGKIIVPFIEELKKGYCPQTIRCVY